MEKQLVPDINLINMQISVWNLKTKKKKQKKKKTEITQDYSRVDNLKSYFKVYMLFIHLLHIDEVVMLFISLSTFSFHTFHFSSHFFIESYIQNARRH